MKGTITSIHPRKYGNGTDYYRVTFAMDSEKNDGSTFWAKTDLCPAYRNFAHWRDYMKVGARFCNLVLRAKDTVEADVKPRFLGIAPLPPRNEKPPDPQMNLFG